VKRRTDQKGDEDLSRYSKAQTHIGERTQRRAVSVC